MPTDQTAGRHEEKEALIASGARPFWRCPSDRPVPRFSGRTPLVGQS